MKRLAILCAALIGCSKTPEKVEMTTNPEIPVETLFTHDGCTVYRFVDVGRAHYFAKCPEAVEVIGTYSESCGKGCVSYHDENIRTPAGRGE